LLESWLTESLPGSPNSAEWKTGSEISGTYDDAPHLRWLSDELKAVYYGPM